MRLYWKMRKVLFAVLPAMAVLTVTAVPHAAAQSFPSKPIRIISVSPPGNPTDTVVRFMLPEMSKTLGQPITIEAMPGSTGMLAHRTVAKSTADGHTLLTTNTVAVAIPVYFKDPGYDMLTDLTPLSMLAGAPIMFVANSQMPFSTFADMVAYAKANPGKLNHGTAGGGDVNVLQMEMIRQKFGIRVIDVPYKVSAAYIQGVVANEVQLAFSALSIVPHLQSKAVRLLAASDQNQNRLAGYPDVPTFAELGLSMEGAGFFLMGVANTPKPVIDRLYAAIAGAIKVPAVSDQIKGLNFQVIGSTPEELGRKLRALDERYRALGKGMGVVPQ